MRRLKHVGSLVLAAAAAMAGVAPQAGAPTAQVQQGSQRSKENAPAPTPAAKPGQIVSAETLGGFTVQAESRREPVWVGYPRGSRSSAGFPFRRQRGKRWA